MSEHINPADHHAHARWHLQMVKMLNDGMQNRLYRRHTPGPCCLPWATRWLCSCQKWVPLAAQISTRCRIAHWPANPSYGCIMCCKPGPSMIALLLLHLIPYLLHSCDQHLHPLPGTGPMWNNHGLQPALAGCFSKCLTCLCQHRSLASNTQFSDFWCPWLLPGPSLTQCIVSECSGSHIDGGHFGCTADHDRSDQ